MKAWTHSICRPCWDSNRPGQEPVRVKDDDTESCCLCGDRTDAGIYIRQDGKTLSCGGDHD